MARITHVQEKAHDDALALLSLTRRLKDEEIEFVYRHYNPMATHRVTKGAIFFTPYEIASDLAVMARLNCGGRVLDYAAGIGVLTHHMLQSEYWDTGDEVKHHVCVEIEAEFVEVGKKLLPQVEWICGNIFDLDLMQSLGVFKMGIANPPFGAIPSIRDAKKWMKAQVPTHLATIEMMVRMCELGGIILMPRADQEYQRDRDSQRRYTVSTALERLLIAFPGLRVGACMELDWNQYPKWQGTDPDVVIANVSVDDMDAPIPFGFADVKKLRLAIPSAVAIPIALPVYPLVTPEPVMQQLALIGE